MKSLATLARNLGPKRLGILLAVVAIAVAFCGWAIDRVSAPAYALLYGDLDMGDASRVVSDLESAAVPYRLENGGTAVFVPADQVPRLRVALAEKGLPAGGSVGYELFDTTSSFGTTNFQQNVNLVRALEGELARTIRSIGAVKSARVHLVLPKREVFSRERQPASASVLLQMRGAGRLTQAQVVAVQHLVASAVPDLPPDRISIVDGRGTLLSETKADGAEGILGGTKMEERRREMESRLSHTIEQLLEKIVGNGKARAEVFADMDFDRINTSEELFNPDGQVVRSTQSISQANAAQDGEAGQPVGVAGNLPDPNAAQGAAGTTNQSSENRSEETVNYEISKKVINHVREAGVIKRLSVAVLVDGTYAADANGNPGYQPRPQAELDQLTALVRSAIGFDAGRGDTVEIVNMRFLDTPAPAEDVSLPLFGLEKNELLKIGQYLLLTVFALLVLLFVVRPVLARVLEAVPAPGARGGVPALGGMTGAPQLTGPEGSAMLSSPTGQMIAGPAGSQAGELIDLGGIEGKVRSSAIRQVGEIVEKHPDQTLSIIRNWLHSGD